MVRESNSHAHSGTGSQGCCARHGSGSSCRPASSGFASRHSVSFRREQDVSKQIVYLMSRRLRISPDRLRADLHDVVELACERAERESNLKGSESTIRGSRSRR